MCYERNLGSFSKSLKMTQPNSKQHKVSTIQQTLSLSLSRHNDLLLSDRKKVVILKLLKTLQTHTKETFVGKNFMLLFSENNESLEVKKNNLKLVSSLEGVEFLCSNFS